MMMDTLSSQKSNVSREDYDIVEKKLNNLNEITVKLLQQLTVTQLSMNSNNNKKISIQAKLRILSDINSNLMQISKISPQAVETFAQQQIIIYVRRILGEISMPKIQALQYFRIILVSQKIAVKLIHCCLPVYIARVIEREQVKKLISSNYQDEAFQTLRLINQWIDRFPHTFPQYLAFLLVSFAELPVTASIDERQRKKDQISRFLKNYIIDIFLSLSIKNTQLCSRCGGFNFLINQITNSVQKSQQIVNKILIFLNDKDKRKATQQFIDISKIFYVLTDIDNVFMEENLKNKNMHEALSKFQTKVSLAKNAIVTLMKSWVGLIYLGNNHHILFSLFEAIKQIPKKTNSELRNSIFQCLQQILSIGDAIIVSKQLKQQFRVSKLIGCFIMSVIQLFIEQNILRILIQFSGVQEVQISEPAQKLLKRITLLIFNFRPQLSQYIDILISAASKNSQNSASQLLKSSSLFVINKISNYIYDKKQKDNHPLFNQLQNLFSLKTIFVPYERASVNSIARTLNFITYKEKQNYRKELFQMQPIPHSHKEQYTFWNWKIIEELLSFPDPEKFKSSTRDRHRQNKLYKYLLRFFSPSRGAFSRLSWQKDNFIYHKVGLLLVKNTITIPQNLPLIRNPPQSQFHITISFIGDLQKLLQIVIMECTQNNNNLNFFKTMQRQLLGYIGLFSEQKIGFQSLLYENTFFQQLYSCLHKQQCSHVVYTILMGLDFYRDEIRKNVPVYDKNRFNSSSSGSQDSNYQSILIGPRTLLKKCLKQGSKSLKIAAVQVIKILIMSQLSQFLIFSYRLIIQILMQYSKQSQIVTIIIESLQRNLTQAKNIQLFIKVINQSIENQPHKIKLAEFNKTQSQNNTYLTIHKQHSKKQRSKQKSEQEFQKKHSLLQQQKTKIYFSDIKDKFSSEIMIRLLSYETGYNLIQREYPDWLQLQYSSWCQANTSSKKDPKAKKQHYCLKVEKKLANSLNFKINKLKQKQAYKIKTTASNESSDGLIYDLLFIYKLPWIVWINNQQYPLWVRQASNQFILFKEFPHPNLDDDHLKKTIQQRRRTSKISMHDPEKLAPQMPFVHASDDCLKIVVAIGDMQVDEEFYQLPKVRDSSLQNRKGILNIFLSINSKQKLLYGQKLRYVESNGVQVYYTKKFVSGMNLLFIRRINIRVKLPNIQDSQQLPLHLIQSLSKTKKGQQFIKKKQYVTFCLKTLLSGSLSQLDKPFKGCQVDIDDKNNLPSLVQMRSALWSIGFYGSTNTGIKTLKQMKAFDLIIELSRNAQTLSLRGTCRYILDMFCHSQNGRTLLSQNGFYVNNNCFTCYPIETLSLYQIHKNPPTNNNNLLKSQEYWNFYNSILKEHPLTKNEQKFFELTTMLISSFSTKTAANQLRQIVRLSPKITYSVNLFQCIITLLTYYKFKHQNRRLIMNSFDQLLRSNTFNQIPNKSMVSDRQKISKYKKSTLKFYLDSTAILDLLKIQNTVVKAQQDKDLPKQQISPLNRVQSQYVQSTYKK